MGILNVSPLGWVVRVMEFSQTSLDNTLDTVKEVHQTMVEIPVNVAEELGLPKQTAADLKNTHRRVLDHIYTGISDSVGHVNQYMVDQAQSVDWLTSSDRPPAAPKIVKIENKK